MFVQVINGRTSDPEALRAHLERWRTELKPGAIGFEGSTVGVADDGTFVILARFSDAGAAERNSSRPEQAAWWDAMATSLHGEPTVRESTEVDTRLDGCSNDAGFVQVMEGTVKDREAARAMEAPEMLEQLRQTRPDLLGFQRVWFDGGAFVEAAYFTSEADARTGESSAEFSGPQQQYMEQFGELTFIDLRDPLLD